MLFYSISAMFLVEGSINVTTYEEKLVEELKDPADNESQSSATTGEVHTVMFFNDIWVHSHHSCCNVQPFMTIAASSKS